MSGAICRHFSHPHVPIQFAAWHRYSRLKALAQPDIIEGTRSGGWIPARIARSLRQPYGRTNERINMDVCAKRLVVNASDRTTRELGHAFQVAPGRCGGPHHCVWKNLRWA